MIDSVVLNIETRTGTGTRISRKLRKDSKIPGILYSHGQNAELITLCHKELLNAIRLGKTVVSIHNGISIDQAVIREIQWDFLGKDPVHVDLGRVNANEKIKVHVSVLTKGISPGVTAGGVLDILMHSVDVECIAADAPKNISINISELQVGSTIHVRDLMLSDGLRILNDPDLVILHVVAKKDGDLKPGDSITFEPEVLTKKKSDESTKE